MDEQTPAPDPDPGQGPNPDPSPDQSPEPTPDLPAVRASDGEREQTVRLLQECYSEGRLTLAEFDERIASAYAARFRPDLDALTEDLPLPERRAENLPSAGARQYVQPREQDRAPARRVSGGTGPATSIAVMGGVERAGSWTLPAQHTTAAVMGGVEIDLRDADLQAHETTIRAFAFWGGIEILVPDDVHVHVEGIGFMGAFSEASDGDDDDHRPVRRPAPDAPVIRVTGLAIMGAVEVRRVSGRVQP